MGLLSHSQTFMKHLLGALRVWSAGSSYQLGTRPLVCPPPSLWALSTGRARWPAPAPHIPQERLVLRLLRPVSPEDGAQALSYQLSGLGKVPSLSEPGGPHL